MGVDPKRPLIGFAVVAVLCAVLMTLSVGRGSASLDLLHPGKPIAGPAGRVHAEPRATAPAAATPVAIPAELSPQPIGVAAATAKQRVRTGKPAAGASVITEPDTQSEPESDAGSETTAGDDTRETKVDRKADRAAEKAQRTVEKAQRTVEKAQRTVEKAQRAAEQAAEQAARDAEKILRDADRLAAQLARTTQKAVAQAARKG